jgi:predicted GIY-YIG superfamily endonuclease
MKQGGYIYVISDGDGYKIGVAKNPERRLKQLQTGNQKKLVLEFIDYKNEPYKIEKSLHRSFHKFKTNGEWFRGITMFNIRSAMLMIHDYD